MPSAYFHERKVALTVVLAIMMAFAPLNDVFADSTVLAGSDWLAGAGVNVMSGGDDSNMCVPVAGATASAKCTTGNVWSGMKWQCVEMINRLYLSKGWTTATWSGNGNTIGDSVPTSLVKENNGAISYINAGDVISLDDGGDGHANVINDMNGTTINMINQNAQLNSSAYVNSGTLAAGSASLKPNAWAGYSILSVIHHPGGETGSGSPSATTPTAIDSQITPDGIQHVYKGTEDGRVWEVAWGNGTLAQYQAASGLGGPVRAISSKYIQGTSGWEQHVYAAVGQNVWEIVWGGGASPGQWKPASNLGSDVVALSSQLFGTNQNQQHVFARSGGKIWEIIWNGGAPYSVWSPTDSYGVNLGTPVRAGISSQIINGQNHVYSLSTGGNGSLYHVAWGNGASGVWTPATNIGVPVSGLTSQLVNGNEHHVYWGSTDGKIGTVRWGGGTTYALWAPATGLGGAVTGVSSSLTASNVENVYYSVGQNVWHTAFQNLTTQATYMPGSAIGAPLLGVSSKVTAGPSGPTPHVYSTTGSDAWETGWGGGATFIQQRVGLGMGY